MKKSILGIVAMFLSFFLFSCEKDEKISLPSATYKVSTLAGARPGQNEDPAEQTPLRGMNSLARDRDGNLFVTDWDNHRIFRISPEGEVSTIISTFFGGYADGPLASAAFNGPLGMVADASGALYVADRNNNCIRKISPEGVVSTYAGSGVEGYANGVAAEARFSWPQELTLDLSGNLFVTELNYPHIRKITPEGVVSTLAGGQIAGYADGAGASAQFYSIKGIAADAFGNVYVTDAHRVRKITPAGLVSTLAGATELGETDGVGTEARFGYLRGIAVDPNGNVYVADVDKLARIRKITPAGVVSFVAGSVSGFADGIGERARFNGLGNLLFDSSGKLYVADANNSSIRVIAIE